MVGICATFYKLCLPPSLCTPNCRWAPSSAGWRLCFSSTREPSSGAVVTDQRVRRSIQIFRLNSTQLKFHKNLSTKYRYIASREISVNGQWMDGRTDSISENIQSPSRILWRRHKHRAYRNIILKHLKTAFEICKKHTKLPAKQIIM